jgi:hypothetical protein
MAKKEAIGFSFPKAIDTLIIGICMSIFSFVSSYLLFDSSIILSFFVMWAIGATSFFMVISYFVDIAFVRSRCFSCRLKPIIVEHEKFHIQGEHNDNKIWTRMRQKYDATALNLNKDPMICSFCPIKKRLLGEDNKNGS